MTASSGGSRSGIDRTAISIEDIVRQLEQVRQRAMTLLSSGRYPLPLCEAGEQFAVPTVQAESSAPQLVQLAVTFVLSRLEVNVILSLLAAECDPAMRALVQVQQRKLGRPCLEIGTIADLCGLSLREIPALKRLFAPTAPLSRWALIERDPDNTGTPFVSQKVRLDSRVTGYLLGEDELSEGMAIYGVDASPPAGEISPALLKRVRRACMAGERLVLELTGRSAAECLSFVRLLGRWLSYPVVTLDAAAIEAKVLGYRLAELSRESQLVSALPALLNWHLISAPPEPLHAELDTTNARIKRRIPASFTKWLQAHGRVLLLAAEEPEPVLGRHTSALITVKVPFPTPLERARLLESALAEHDLVPAPDIDLPSMTRRFALDTTLIHIAARQAREAVHGREVGSKITLHSELLAACRQQVSHDLKSVAERVEHSHRWEDLVIPVDVYHSLQEMIAFVRHAARVYDEWGFGGKHSLAQGVSALFAGPPGTGKTMCASVMARELDMELFRVDLSRVVSKWIGETEKNLSKVFDEAQHSNAIILFDEADSLFAKRTEVRSSIDRYANLEVNFLLQRMEAFSGVTILTTNFEDTIDTAFKRRLTFKMRFEKPDGEARAALWQKMFPESCARAADLDFDKLGQDYEMSGGNIRSAVLRAAFLAADSGSPVTMALCRQAAEREAREMGLLIRTPVAPASPPIDHDNPDQPPPRGYDPGKPPKGMVPITRPRR